MKKMFRHLLCAAAAMFAAVCAMAASPPAEQVPRPQMLQQQTETVGLVMGDMMAAQKSQYQGLVQQQLKQQFDPPVMINTVLPKGMLGGRMPWLDASALPLGITKLPLIDVLSALDRRPKAGIALSPGGPGCIDGRMPGIIALDKLPFREKMNV